MMMGPNAIRMADGSVDVDGHMKEAAELKEVVKDQKKELDDLKKKVSAEGLETIKVRARP